MDQIGYSAIDINAKREVWFVGDIYGQCAGFPDCIFLPNLIQIFNPNLNENYLGYKVVMRFIQDGTPESIEVQDDKVIVTRPLPVFPPVDPPVVVAPVDPPVTANT